MQKAWKRWHVCRRLKKDLTKRLGASICGQKQRAKKKHPLMADSYAYHPSAMRQDTQKSRRVWSSIVRYCAYHEGIMQEVSFDEKDKEVDKRVSEYYNLDHLIPLELAKQFPMLFHTYRRRCLLIGHANLVTIQCKKNLHKSCYFTMLEQIKAHVQMKIDYYHSQLPNEFHDAQIDAEQLVRIFDEYELLFRILNRARIKTSD